MDSEDLRRMDLKPSIYPTCMLKGLWEGAGVFKENSDSQNDTCKLKKLTKN